MDPLVDTLLGYNGVGNAYVAWVLGGLVLAACFTIYIHYGSYD